MSFKVCSLSGGRMNINGTATDDVVTGTSGDVFVSGANNQKLSHGGVNQILAGPFGCIPFKADLSLAEGAQHLGSLNTETAGDVSVSSSAIDHTHTTRRARNGLNLAGDTGASSFNQIDPNTTALIINDVDEKGATLALFPNPDSPTSHERVSRY